MVFRNDESVSEKNEATESNVHMRVVDAGKRIFE